MSHVLDVAAGDDLVEAGSQQRAGGVTLLNDHVTSVVDLRAVPPLPLNSQPGSNSASQQDWTTETLA